ncbi:alpha-carbonic anhydrase domain-containing protein, partial [Haematococcus lacustris]
QYKLKLGLHDRAASEPYQYCATSPQHSSRTAEAEKYLLLQQHEEQRQQHPGGHVLDVTRPFVNASYLPVRAVPLQLHFHTASEHTIGGAYYPLELHIVHVVPQSSMPACPASGCLAVAGVMFALSDDDVDNPTLDSIWSVMPMREGLVNYMPANMTLNMQAMLPRNRTYVQYSGSLTTPPCSEGVLWHGGQRVEAP